MTYPSLRRTLQIGPSGSGSIVIRRWNASQSPSGENAGVVSSSAVVSTPVLPLPSAFITQRSWFVCWACTSKQIFVPSHEKRGDMDLPATADPIVRLVIPLPSAFMTNTSFELPVNMRTKQIFVPSGLNRGIRLA
ncbi:MAG: hypothetical protein BWY59_01395 [Verrucomicrobia bacterium ADurb.Bin345]|nr:MAG: hypothetical protein BWY59_01395 [Verrucomicrobia bacterium ADurb.Bin345]